VRPLAHYCPIVSVRAINFRAANFKVSFKAANFKAASFRGAIFAVHYLEDLLPIPKD
jgi:hypothetical protein